MRRKQLLSDNALQNLASLVAAVEAAETADLPWRNRASVHFLRNFTIEPVEPYLKFHVLREDIEPLISFGGYDTMSQEILDPQSSINRNRPDIIVLSLLLEYLDSGSNARDWTADEALARLEALIELALEQTNALIIANTLPDPIDTLLNNAASDGIREQLARLNERMRELAQSNPQRMRLSDWEKYVMALGAEKAIDQRFWKLSQAPFRADLLNRIAIDVARYVRALKGRTKKCLVLDCDNTIWGGVIGEDGAEGIALHPDEMPGSAFYALQRSAIELRENGVLLALCSKNNEADVWEVLDTHPHCLLKRSHLVASRINWENKAENIASIADELNIGVDSLVFVDDNPRECALVQEYLPDVTVIPLPADLEQYGELLTRDGLFDSLTQSDEDRRRTHMYQEAMRRQQHENRFTDLTDYLKSLDTVAEIGRPSEADLARVAQLTQRTNQFNLTTRRYSETDIRKFVSDDNSAVCSMKVRDRYGDMGLTGVFIATREGSTGTIDSLMLSCRVLGRQLEFAFVDQCAQMLEEMWHLDEWKAEYIPTAKNAQVAAFWDQIGFTLTDEDGGQRRYLAKAASRPTEYMNVITVRTERNND